MDYRVASNIRGKSLSSLITDRITSGGSVGSSIKGAISDKLKARGTGIKEKFDPMNIARAMTGGGKLAPAILGRITGRSQSDINYFAGNKRKKYSSYTKMPSIGQVPSEGFGGSAVEVLNKMLSFMQKNREDDLKRKQISMSFEEERQSEEQRRHGEFLKVLKDFTSVGTTTMVKKEPEKEKSLFDEIVDLFSKGSFLTRLIPLLINPVTLAVAAVLVAKYGLQKVADATPNMSILTPKEAQALLESGNPNEIESFPGGRDALVNIVKNGAENAKKSLEDFKAGNITETELNKLGGEKRLTEMSQQTGLTVPEKKELPANVVARPKSKGIRQIQWDNLYGARYNQDGTLKIEQPPITTEIPQPTATPATDTTTPPAATPVTETTTPVPSEPPSSAVVGKIQENNDLNMQSTMTAGASSSPSVSVNNSSTSAPDQTVTATATTRDDTPILDLVLNRTKARV